MINWSGEVFEIKYHSKGCRCYPYMLARLPIEAEHYFEQVGIYTGLIVARSHHIILIVWSDVVPSCRT